ncbi:hypothetical protein VH64_22560 [Salmonella enterica subsp. enterica serovar Enteritidis]|nr:hypothetical protein [Salmonella enterica]EBW6952712.1 hypothetical protein [Salmonella enterica subsp. enterica serovar Typhimurium]ECF2727020.1 hypothetical protein [Salmonella enterica subsp. enterica serovar Enteritidis]EBU6292835.1 hypothetical protein [Salmonella enterica]EBY2294410.1 hypothetical protein [Salmonella enterica subsp. enterica serovar Typhimurium]
MRPFFYLSPIPRVVRHSGDSVQTLLVTTYTEFISFIWCSAPVYAPISWVIQDNLQISSCPAVHIRLDKNALSEKMSKNFFGDRNFYCRTHLSSRS